MGAIWSSCRKVWKYNKYFKNSFAWLMGLTELIFGYKNFFGSGLFLTFFLIWWIQKMPQAKKDVNIKNQFLHARQPRERILIFVHTGVVFLQLLARASNGSHYSNFENWCLKMKSWGLYHAYILWKSGLILDFQQSNPL